MVFNLKIRTNEDLDLLCDDERADVYCNYLTDVSDVHYFLIQMQSTYPNSISLDRIDDMLILNDDCYCITDYDFEYSN